MQPKLMDLRWSEPDRWAMDGLIRHVSKGDFLCMPTETVYGLSCLPEPSPVGELLEFKERGPDRPFLLLVPGVGSVPELEWTPEATELAEVFWPGALTLILRDPNRCFPPGVRSPSGGVAVRVTSNPLARSIVRTIDGPLVSTSANLSGEDPAGTGEAALKVVRKFPDASRFWVLDVGPLEPSRPSTIVDCTGDQPLILRSGAIPSNRVRCVLPEIHDESPD